jgi:hypothetical protein
LISAGSWYLKTHSGVLPQLRTLEVAVADNRLGKDETDRYEMPCYNIPEGSPPKVGVTRPVRAFYNGNIIWQYLF